LIRHEDYALRENTYYSGEGRKAVNHGLPLKGDNKNSAAGYGGGVNTAGKRVI
jgi:predicted outer membrane repeat protein